MASAKSSSNSRVNIYFDLDGPLLDVSDRYFQVHQVVIDKVQALDKERFWCLKRERKDIPEILRLCGSDMDDSVYLDRWLELIETTRFLAYDVLVPQAQEVLEKLVSNSRLCVVTLRRDAANLHWQLRELGLARFFAMVFCGSSASLAGCQAKANLIRSDAGFASEHSVLVGDTEIDILAGRELGIAIVVAVLNGIRTRELLEASKPDFMIPDITALPELLGMIWGKDSKQ